MKKNLKIVITVFVCLAMLASIVACGAKEGDKAYKNWSDNSMPRMKQDYEDFQANFAEAGDDRDMKIAALMEYIARTEDLINELAAIDKSTMSDQVKTEVEQKLAQMQSEMQPLIDALSDLDVSD